MWWWRSRACSTEQMAGLGVAEPVGHADVADAAHDVARRPSVVGGRVAGRNSGKQSPFATAKSDLLQTTPPTPQNTSIGCTPKPLYDRPQPNPPTDANANLLSQAHHRLSLSPEGELWRAPADVQAARQFRSAAAGPRFVRGPRAAGGSLDP